MALSSILIWNVRGLNNKARRDSVRELINTTRPQIVCFQETKIQDMTHNILLSTLGAEFTCHVALHANGTRGGVLVAWQSSACQALTTRVDSFSVSVLFQNMDGQQWWFTGVYGPQQDAQKVLFLQELRTVRAVCPGPWVITGDFNLIYRAADKNNSNIDRAMMGRFRRTLNNLCLKESELLGRRFTWSNERASPTLVRLDRVFFDDSWETIFPNHLLQSSAAGVSDHCPLILSLNNNFMGKRRFHFECFWPKIEGFHEAVQQAWMLTGNSGGPIERLDAKLRATSRALQSWSQKKVGNVAAQLHQARELLLRLEIAQDRRTLTPEEAWMRRQLKQHSLALASLHRTIMRARSRLDWLSEGDANTSFFHAHARYRKRKSFIASLRVGDQLLTTEEEKEEAVWHFYNELLGTPQQRDETLNLQAFYQPPHDLSGLDSPISEQEVWVVIKALPPDKAPGPDGFTNRFYKSCWAIIKQDVMAAVGAIHAGDARKLHLVNSAYMVLIPKKDDPKGVGDYRPISLVHSFGKLITKIMANRLAPKLPAMIAANQSAFIRGRRIHDSFLLVHHMARFLHNQRKPRLMLKLDITKAFDSVSWAFLLEVLTHLGFGHRWRTLLCNLLATSSTRVLLNGQPGTSIRHYRGLRQGDPLSPMLFIIVMDVLSRLISKAEERSLLEPLTSKTLQHRVSLYADDVVLFTTPKEEDLALTKALLHKFGQASGLHTNLSKSSIVPIQCDETRVELVRQHMDCQIASFPCKYLGLPLSIRRLTKTDLQPILDKIADKLPGWKADLLDKSGRLILVKAVLTAIPIYLLFALDIPQWFIKAVDKWRRSFLWRGRKELNGGHCPVAWQQVTRPLHLGGLGVHDLQAMAWALRMRWLWMEKTQPDRPWGLLRVHIPEPARAMFAVSVATTLGDGRTTLFWTDKWVHGQAIADLAPALMQFVRRRGWRHRTVCEAMHEGAWERDIIGGLSVLATWQMLQLCDIIGQTALDPSQPDKHTWLPSQSGEFSSKSAYERLFVGGIEFEPHKRLWRSWAPLKAKLFLWLAYWNRCWTADRLQRRGLPHPAACPLCDQHDETIDHLLIRCVFTREIWHHVFQWIGTTTLEPQGDEASFHNWWRRTNCRAESQARKGVNSMIILTAWYVWKYRNRVVFDGVSPRPQALTAEIMEEAKCWVLAGARRLGRLLQQ